METIERVEVMVNHGPGAEGVGWYAWETDYPEDGCVYFSPTQRPSAADLRAINEAYVEAGR